MALSRIAVLVDNVFITGDPFDYIIYFKLLILFLVLLLLHNCWGYSVVLLIKLVIIAPIKEQRVETWWRPVILILSIRIAVT